MILAFLLNLQASQAHPSRGKGKHAKYKNYYYICARLKINLQGYLGCMYY